MSVNKVKSRNLKACTLFDRYVNTHQTCQRTLCFSSKSLTSLVPVSHYTLNSQTAKQTPVQLYDNFFELECFQCTNGTTFFEKATSFLSKLILILPTTTSRLHLSLEFVHKPLYRQVCCV